MKEGTRASRTGKQWLVDIGALFLLAMVLLFVGLVVQTCRIMANPATATGVVESKRIIEGGSENPTEYRLRYSFTARSGGAYGGTAGVSGDIYERTAVGAPIEVQYAADDPGNNRVISETGDPEVVESVIAAVTLLGMFVFFGPRRWLAWRRGEPDPVLTDSL
ncbi:MAG: DUF3592 domain-containing protein [Chloroflexota bacterium]